MDAALPFRPQGTGVLLAAQPNTPPAASQPQGPNAGDVVYLIYNPSGGADCYVGFGPTSVSAVANAIVPLISAPVPQNTVGGGTFVAPAGTLQGITLSPSQYFAARTQLGSASVWIAPGYGV